MRSFVVCVAFAVAFLASQSVLAAGAGPAQTSAATKTVNISGFKFHPQKLEIGKGTKVVFSNASSTPHTATDKGVFDTGRIKSGRAAAVRFERKGTFSYHCKIHPFMKGKIVVD